MSNLRILRKKLRLTQEGLEQRTGVSQAMISTFENLSLIHISEPTRRS